jgi:4-amino-4-deoxy-L-arabinose transferase-like glycosyltransferase
LLGVARIARYDVLAVAFGWLALLALDLALRRPNIPRALLLGIACGVAALTQFMGVFVVPVVIAVWLLARARLRLLFLALGAAALTVLPWAAFGAMHFADVAGQVTVYAGRGDFLRPAFYIENVLTESGRYEHLFGDRSFRVLLLTVGLWPALAYVVWRSRDWRSVGDLIVWTSLVVFAGLLLVLDHGKSSVYAVALVPSVCLALSRAATGSIAWVLRTNPLLSMRLLAVALGALLFVRVCVDGVAAYQITLAQADTVSPYDNVAQQLTRALPPGARVFGPERWWWALHTHPYLSLRSVWWQWLNNQTPPFLPEYVIVNDNVRADIQLFPAPIQQRFWAYLETCTTLVTTIEDPNYFGIDVYLAHSPSYERGSPGASCQI